MSNYQLPDPNAQQEMKRMMLAMVLVLGTYFAWQFFFPPPKPTPAQLQQQAANTPAVALPPGMSVTDEAPAKPRTEAIAEAGRRLPIISGQLHGSLSLKGSRFDDVTLARYRQTVDKKSPEITLLSPSTTAEGYFAEFGWLSSQGVKLPDNGTLWKTDAKEIRPNQRVVLWWENGQGLRFERRITLDSHYMFTIEQVVINQGAGNLQLTPFGRIQRRFDDLHLQHYAISHEGPLGVLGNELHEVAYKDLREKGPKAFPSTGGWLGFGDKYWLTAAVLDSAQPVQAQFSLTGMAKDGTARYQAEYAGTAQSLEKGQSITSTTRFFAGAKEVKVLDAYTKAGVPLFDRAVDFGVLYFLTKPIFLLLNWFYQLVGNFGVAILLLTVVIKGLMFPLANKSYRAMNQMKRLQPEMEKLKTRYADDKPRFQKEVMEMYKREKVTPAAGCLPMIIQIPVFFALYKVLFVTIEMRHAPFFGWIHDLSAPDPSNLLTLFGAVPWNVPDLHIMGMHFSHLAWWPLVFCLTMVVQQSFQPKPSDPMQGRIMAALPFILLFLFSGFPAGLVIYWSWSNSLTILQQYVNNKLHGDEKAVAKAVPAKKNAPKGKPASARR